MDQKIITLFDTYTHGGMIRRDFLDKLTLMAGSAAAATAFCRCLKTTMPMLRWCRRMIHG